MLAWVAQAHASAIEWRVRIDDPDSRYTDVHSTIEYMTTAAGRDWGSHIIGSGTVEVVVRFDDIPTATGGARVGEYRGTTNEYRGTDEYHLWEFGPQTVIRTGLGASDDDDGPRDDLRITLGYDYMDDRFWWDPDPYTRREAVPTNKMDAYSTLLHEIGHGLGFYGWRDRETGLLPSDYMSTYDQWVYMEDELPWFGGPAASAVYGGPVPLTDGNLMHYGNEEPLPGWELAEDLALMNGVRSASGARKSIGELDIAFLDDIGYVIVPEPESLILLLIMGPSVLKIAYCHRRRSKLARLSPSAN